MKKVLVDVFGRDVIVGDIILYSSSTGFQIAVVEKLFYNRLGYVRSFRLVYPGYDGQSLKSRKMRLGEQEILLVSTYDLINYCGQLEFGRRKEFIPNLLILRNKILEEKNK